MKRFRLIALLLWVGVAACTPRNDVAPSVETRQGTSLPTEASPALANIDSLMWRQPDSALMVLMDYFASRDSADSVSTTDFDGHYAQLLAAELLYKNDYPQTNRLDLLWAVDYFDSFVREVPSFKGAGRIQRASYSNLFFLVARAHYIKGVGYYEQDSVVPACKEYLKALEIMEGHFGEKELVGKKAKFMTYTNNRLMELFSAQFMMEPAIACGEQALLFCRIEPTSSQGVSNILYQLGKQYNKKGEKEIARSYYCQAIEGLVGSNSLLYRDIVSSKALCDYQLGTGIEQCLDELRKAIVQANSENERLNRYLTMGVIFSEGGIYDSAQIYLEPVYENTKSLAPKIQAANYLHIIYDSLGYREKSDACLRFLSEYMKTEGENKALVAKLDEVLQNYMNHKQEKQAKEERKATVEKMLKIVVPLVLAIALAVFALTELKGKKMLKKQQVETTKKIEEKEQKHEEEAKRMQVEIEQKHRQKMEEIVKMHEEELRRQKDRSEKELEKIRKRHEMELEEERLAYQSEKATLLQSLRQHEEQLNTMEAERVQHQTVVASKEMAFLNEPVCRSIMDSIGDLHLSARSSYGEYHHVRLDEATGVALGEAVARHFPNFKTQLTALFPKMDRKDLQMCYLYLLRMNNQQIAVLQQCHNSTIHRRAEQMQKALKTNIPLHEFVRDLAYEQA